MRGCYADSAVTLRRLSRRGRIAALLGCSVRANIARLRLSDETDHVLREQVALPPGVARRVLHRHHVRGMTPVPLLERQARISVSHALCLRVRERDHAADVVAHLPDVEPGRGDVPAEIRAEWRVA